VSIFFHAEDISFTFLQKRKTKAWINKVISSYNRIAGNINIIFCSDSYLLSINKEYLNHDYFTDVITFDMSVDDKISGDIFISLDKVKVNASEWSVSFESELFRVMIHGVLHLLGFDDNTEYRRKEMRKLEDNALSLLID